MYRKEYGPPGTGLRMVRRGRRRGRGTRTLGCRQLGAATLAGGTVNRRAPWRTSGLVPAGRDCRADAGAATRHAPRGEAESAAGPSNRLS